MMLTIVESAPLGLLEEVLEGLLVAEPAGVDERVTPARAQFFLAVSSAVWRSLPLQLLKKHAVVLLMKSVSSHRHLTSPDKHLVDLAFAKQGCEHVGYPET